MDSSWDQFHQDYDALRNQLADLNQDETVARLGLLVDQFRSIVAGVHELPTAEATVEIVQFLAQTVEEEELSLRSLRGAFQSGTRTSRGTTFNGSDSVGDDTDQSEANGQLPEENPATENGGTEQSEHASLFDSFDAQLVASNSARLRAKQRLARVQEDISSRTEEVVAEFTGRFDQLLQELNDFHRDYDEWRGTEGGCNRSRVIEALGRFTLTFRKIADDARALPAATVLRPMGEILVEATEREERALRELRNRWQPYDVEVYGNLDQERSTSGKLRRQVAAGIQELFERFGIPAQ